LRRELTSGCGPTYELLKKQKETLERKHEKEISMLKKQMSILMKKLLINEEQPKTI
jgi:hypothetical protein